QSQPAGGIGVFFVYLVMGASYLSIFKDLLLQLILLVGLAGVIHFFLFGIVKSFHLNILKPLNQFIIGYDFAPGVGPGNIKKTIAEIKKIPIINTMTAVLLSVVVVLFISFLAYQKTGDTRIGLNALLSGGLAVMLYATFTFIFTSAIIKGLRRKAYSLYRSYSRPQKL
ncbi:MAG: hypothetical protein MUE70_15500, partial [Desulfobacterales bacterium]|nr:hypothetical protein [Desulfobacterales bacterium]